MLTVRKGVLAAAFMALALAGCAGQAGSGYDKPGFKTEVKEGRLWVFREGSKDYDDYKKKGEPAKMVSRIGEGPNGMTIRSGDTKTIEDYMKAK
jgi:hypothetical protein